MQLIWSAEMKEECLVTVWCGGMSSYGMFMVFCLRKEHCEEKLLHDCVWKIRKSAESDPRCSTVGARRLKMEQRSTWLTAPPLYNSSCSHPRYLSASNINTVTLWDMMQGFFIFLLSAGILVANVLLVVVINSGRYSKYIHSQVRGATVMAVYYYYYYY